MPEDDPKTTEAQTAAAAPGEPVVQPPPPTEPQPHAEEPSASAPSAGEPQAALPAPLDLSTEVITLAEEPPERRVEQLTFVKKAEGPDEDKG